MSTQVDLEYVAELALKEGLKTGCSDVSIIASKSNDSQVRFSNNAITLVNNVRNLTFDVYLAKDRKRIVGTSNNPTDHGVKRFIESLARSCASLPPSDDYVPLPSGPFKYEKHGNFDPKVQDADLIGYVGETIDSGVRAGAFRISGSLNTESTEFMVLTSAGASGRDRQSMMLMNVRAFCEDNASGHGLSCTSYLSDFDPTRAGQSAGDYAKRSLNPRQLREGKYDVIFSSTVVANIMPVVGAASAFAIESGMSFLADKLGQKVGVEYLDIVDQGVPERGLGGRSFDDEGLPTGYNKVISGGVFKTILHNSTTARKFNVTSTGNAGIIMPRANTIEFKGGDVPLEEMIGGTKSGVLITNNWYTRYQNQRTGEYSTVPRDAAFRIEGGRIVEPLYGLRVSDSIPRQLSNIAQISKERNWIKWWEVATPTLAPAMKVIDVSITRAVGS
ncbi:MAG: TldD/PmbA family protein [Nitrososphaerales archaeon]